NFSIITTYRMYAEMIEKLHASNMKLFTLTTGHKYLSIGNRSFYEFITDEVFHRQKRVKHLTIGKYKYSHLGVLFLAPALRYVYEEVTPYISF
ncbi:MAG: hypothetical protein K9K37_10375, partial [Desulfocapsa sp.]|nr:hypothetical protein [Desulfocapsa sp.]